MNKIIYTIYLFLFLSNHTLSSQNYFLKTVGNDTINTFLKAGLVIEDGYLAIGTYASHSHKALYVVKLDAKGDSVWLKVLHTTSLEKNLSMNTGHLFIQLKNQPQHFLVAYNKTIGDDINIGLIKFDISGEIMWHKDYGNEYQQAPYQVLQTQDKGFIIVGTQLDRKTSNSFSFAHIVKIDSLGNQEWEQTYTLDERQGSVAYNIIETLDGGYLIGGYGHRLELIAEWDPPIYDYDTEGYLVKIDAIGNVEWEQSYGTEWDDSGLDVLQYPDSTYLVHGRKGADHSIYNYLTFRHIDPRGKTISETTYNEWTTGIVYSDLYPTDDGGFLGMAFVKFTETNFVRPRLMRFTPYCKDTLWTKVLNVEPTQDLGLRDVERTPDSGFLLVGFRFMPNPQFGWVLKTDSLGNSCFEFGCDSLFTNIEEISKSEQKLFSLFPNPTKGEVTISFSHDIDVREVLKESELMVLDVTGQVVRRLDLNGLKFRSTFNVEGLKTGVYFVDWRVGGKNLGVEKLVVLE